MTKIEDSYQIEFNQQLHESDINTLCSLYQPLIGLKALSLYFLLYSEKNIAYNSQKLERLYKLASVDHYELLQILNNLEQFSLLKTYLHKTSVNLYLFVLNKPLSYEKFMSNNILSRLLISKIGPNELYNNSLKFQNKLIDKKEYQNISKSFDMERLKDFQYHEDQELKYFNANIFKNNQMNWEYDIEGLLSMTTEFLFPSKFRTRENLDLIAKYGSLYGITIKEMNQIISLLLVNGEEFDQKLFESSILQFKPKVKETKNKYLLPSIQFLMQYQNGNKLVDFEKKIIEDLSFKLNLPNDVINVIIEYCLKTGNNRLARNYVESVASTLIRAKVSDYQSAIKFLNESYKTAQNNRKIVTKKEEYNLPIYKSNKADLTSDELEELKKWLKEGKDGQN